jgi:4-amino-4-deoxy-L-arabinose transferase-like glycosyltransferase
LDGGSPRRRRWLAGARAALRRVPRAAWICVLVATLNGAAWSVIVPPFQGHDEVDHFAYVDHLAQSGTLPGGPGAFEYSPAESLVMSALGYYTTRFTPFEPSLTTSAQQHVLIEAVNAGASLEQPAEVGVATSEPPLYYVVQLIPYELGSGNILVQLQLMRLLSVLLAAVTVLLTFLFLREILPGAPWAATVGALCVALEPQLMSASSIINPDSLDFTITAAVFLCLARAFHHGFTRARAVTLGLLVVAGFLTKLTFVGIALGLVVSVPILAVREVRARGWGTLKPVAALAAIGLVPAILYAIHNAAAGRPTFGPISGSVNSFVSHASVDELSYIWQLYLPRLPGMTHYFAGVATYKDIWWDRWVGFYGWMDTMFPEWVDNVALIPAAIITGLCVRELYARRAAVRARLSEFAGYAAVAVGLLVMLGVSSFNGDVIDKTSAFAEPRYLVPLVPLLGAVVVLAVRGAGRRWAPIVAAAVVMLFLGHDLISQLQVIGRYYG